MPLTSGSIWFDDTRIDVPPPEKRGFGMVFQKLVTTLHVIPVTPGTVPIADRRLSDFGPGGWFPLAVHALHFYTHDEIRLTHNGWGVLIPLIVSGFPFAFLLTLSYITGIDPTLARRGCDARHIRTHFYSPPDPIRKHASSRVKERR